MTSIWSSAERGATCKVHETSQTTSWINTQMLEKLPECWIASDDVRSVLRILRNSNCKRKLCSSLSALLATHSNTPLA